MHQLEERSLVVLKPDTLTRGLVGEVIQRFERAGLKLVGIKMVQVDKSLADKHYPLERREFIEGMGNKTLENYQQLGVDPRQELGTADAYEIGKIVRQWLVEMITAGPVVAMVWQGPSAIEVIRKLVGHTLPVKAAPGTIRGDFSYDSSYLANRGKRAIKNLIHASGNKEEADYEINLWFNDKEIFEYQRDIETNPISRLFG